MQKKIIPNNRLAIETRINSYNRGIAKCQGEGKINNKLACSAEFNVVLPHVINYYKKKFNPKNKFCFIYCGTLGYKHNPNLFITLAERFPEAIIIISSKGKFVNEIKTISNKNL